MLAAPWFRTLASRCEKYDNTLICGSSFYYMKAVPTIFSNKLIKDNAIAVW